MKDNIKTSIIGSAIAAMVAIGGTAQAQTSQSVSGWGTTGYGTGGTGAWSISGDSGGDFTIGGGTLSSGAGWAALFPTVTLGVGDSIDLTGQFTITGGTGASGPFRMGLFDDLGNLGTLNSGAWSGGSASKNMTGYMVAPPTQGHAPSGGGEFTGRVNGGYATTQSPAYGFGTSTSNPNSLANDTFDFDLKLTQLSATSVQLDFSLVGQSATPYSEIVSATDSSGAATANTTYDAVAFYLSNSGTSATQLAFTGVQITTTPVPEPASLSLLGGGLLGFLLIRRSRMN